MKKPIKQFASYVNEKDKVDPYHLVIFSHNDPHDPNKTGPLLQESARKMNLKVDAVDFQAYAIAFWPSNPDLLLVASCPRSTCHPSFWLSWTEQLRRTAQD